MPELVASQAAPRPPRVLFIDVLRAFAILMMLQGHFVDTTLDPIYRNADSWVYNLWFFMRGLTAPIFFTTTGLVFIYLLLKDGRPLKDNKRVAKGIRRGFFLIFLGYALKMNLFAIAFGHLYAWYFTVDVLHCIGLALLALIGLYALHRVSHIPLWLLLIPTGAFLFLLEPSMLATDWSWLPRPIANFFTLENGSVFTPVPWVGYTLIGGAIGYLLHHRPRLAFRHWFPMALALLGYTVSEGSHDALVFLDDLTGWRNFQAVADSNGFFWRLGHVFITIAIFMWGIGRFSQVPKLITSIGSETLTIYSVHYIVLFGTWFGVGVSYFFTRSLGPWGSGLGALAFVSSFVVLIYYIEDIRAFLYPKLEAWKTHITRLFRLFLWRLITKHIPSMLQRVGRYQPERRLVRWLSAARYLF